MIGVSHIVKEALDEFPSQYISAGQVCGLDKKTILLSIQLPILIRQILPQLLTLQVNMLQMTLFASLISVEELFRVAQHINSITYRPVEIYTALALFFMAICLPLNLLAYWFKKTFTRNFSET